MMLNRIRQFASSIERTRSGVFSESSKTNLISNRNRQFTSSIERTCSRSGAFVESLEESRVLVLYTGGTLGMRRDENGKLSCEKGYLTERLKSEILAQEGMPKCDVLEYEDLIDSSFMSPKRWKQIASDIEKQYEKYDGFVIAHGTDTMAYTASALSFMLSNLGKPVILTGSNIPMCEPINDAARNLTASILYAGALDVPEVCIFFNNQLLRGNRTVKVDNGGLNAFESPNYPPLATLKVNTKLHSEYVLRYPRRKLKVRKSMQENVIVIKLVPGFQDEAIQCMIEHSDLSGLVFEFYGSGNGLARKTALCEAIESAIEKDIVVVAATQCLRGTVDLSAYKAGVDAELASRVVSSSDMTTEATVTKLSYLLGLGLPLSEVRDLMETPLCGELTTLQEYKNVDLTRRPPSMLSPLRY